MYFLLLWQHWLVCLIAWFRTETAHSLLPIQQSGSMVSPGETDVVRFLCCCCTDLMVDKKHISHGVCDLECLVWSEIAGLHSLSL